MKIKMTLADTEIKDLSEKQYDAYVSELTARIEEVYPSSSLVISHFGDTTLCSTEGFHDDEAARIVVHELQIDVFQHGHWRNHH